MDEVRGLKIHPATLVLELWAASNGFDFRITECIQQLQNQSRLASGQYILFEYNTLKGVYQLLPSDWPICLVLNSGVTGQGS